MHDAYRRTRDRLRRRHDRPAEWEQATRQQRQLAVAADAELRRRHPGQPRPPLRSAEPEPANQEQRDELTLTAGQDIPQHGQWIIDLAARHRDFADKLADRQSRDPRRRPRLRRPRPGIPRLDGCRPGRDPPAAQAPDPAIAADPGTSAEPRSGHGSRRVIATKRTMETGDNSHGSSGHFCAKRVPIADSARSVGMSIIVMSGRILCSSVCAAPERSTLGGQCRRA